MILLDAVAQSHGRKIRRLSDPTKVLQVIAGHLVRVLTFRDGSESPYVQGFGMTDLNDLLATDWTIDVPK